MDEGKFQLYSKIDPPLEAGEWRLEVSQNLKAQSNTGTLSSDDLNVDKANIHFRIRSPRYIMPPDQILSTYPPANSFGSYGSRLPQVVIKRRTLPWERKLDDAPSGTPWLALVLIAEGEARLDTGVAVADCVTPGVSLTGVADVAKGNRLVVRKSVIDKVFPTQNDVELLAHAREVDISDTELMMGDDDGFLAVVISNRLPVPAKDENGKKVPVKYLACLINLEEQFDSLLPKSPDPEPAYATNFILPNYDLISNATAYDHRVMGTAASPDRVAAYKSRPDFTTEEPTPLAQSKSTGSTSYSVKAGAAPASGTAPSSKRSQWSSMPQDQLSSSEISIQMAQAFHFIQDVEFARVDPEYHFPVLLHWSFTTTGSTTFRSLMEEKVESGLDSRLLGDTSETAPDLDGRLPLEVVESGHVGLGHKTREGDDTRSWYRGPLIPHPTRSATEKRLPLAHSSDQLRIVIPDGREDLSLATAFETGRLLTLSQPSIIASLMRWRQGQYYAARMASMVKANSAFWGNLLGSDQMLDDFNKLGPIAGRFFIDAVVNNPETFLGSPRPLVTAGRPLNIEGQALDTLAMGMGMDPEIFKGEMGSVLKNVQMADAAAYDLNLGDFKKVDLRETLERHLNTQRINLVSDTLSSKFVNDPITGPAFPITDLNTRRVVPGTLDHTNAASVDSGNAMPANRGNGEEEK